MIHVFLSSTQKARQGNEFENLIDIERYVYQTSNMLIDVLAKPARSGYLIGQKSNGLNMTGQSGREA